ncbi:aminopeptidase N [Buchananella hordeovulneris]|uniref:aminopeptidase N n=1 Tax=Buchananella hordeovulneris TaxID=52770 RepID=UPI000F5EE21B|nr:aminopeptidase N [Buchananella hordeovulneris]RRD44982.1 aminopeptidase N [Buchananella hordeovulneris]
MPGENLTRVEAEERASLVHSAAYQVELDLTAGEETFFSRTTVTFAATPGAETFIDLIAGSLRAANLNGTDLDLASYTDSRLPLPQLAAENTLVVEADCVYSHTGEGLHRFVDPADGQAYVYSQFEVADSRRVFAVFEQPDLKGTFQFTVTAPADWQLFSNSPTPQPLPVRDGVARWEFTPTEKMSSYIAAIVGGPFQGATGSLTSADGREIPLGVWARASLAEHLDAEEIMDITRAGFAFYESHFACPYPFRKYDQIFVPEFNAGAMENAGCVTFRDQYVFRSKPVEAMVERRAVTILHELAHMWFGDLVTMKWWNDLWLNESFAEFASTLCTAEATRWSQAWTTFASLEKAWAYAQDQLASTHPIVATINDLEDVEVNFDGITYAKGASVLRQLVAYVGREEFFAGLRAYFAKHAWGNTVLADLLTELEATSGRDLQAWSSVWLEEAGITLLRPEIETDADGVVTRAVLHQEAFSPGASLRPHRLVVGSYNLVDGQLQRTGRLELDVDGAVTELSDLVGQPRPALLLVNDEDLAYAKVRFDAESLATARAHVADLSDSMARALILAGAWDMTRDGEWSARDYIDLVLGALGTETDSTVIMMSLRQLKTALTQYVAPANREATAVEVGERLLRLAQTAPAGSDAQLQLVSAAARHIATPDHAEAIAALLHGEQSLMGLEIDVDLKWTLVIGLAAAGALGETEIAEFEAADNTVTGKQKAAQARASLPTAAAKEAAFKALAHDDTLPNGMVEHMVPGYRDTADVALLVPGGREYFTLLSQWWSERTGEMAQTLVEALFPVELAGWGEELGFDVVAAGRDWLAANPDAAPALRRLVVEGLDRAERAVRAQAADVR